MVIQSVSIMSVRTSVAIRGVSKFKPKAQTTRRTPKSDNNRRASRARMRRMARAQRKLGSLHASSQEPVIQRRGRLDQPASGGFVAVPPCGVC